MRDFVAHLRLNGFALGVGETALALTALDIFPPLPLPSAKNCLRAVLVGERGEWARFDDLFDSFWLARGVRVARPLAAAEYSPTTRNLWSAALPALAESAQSHDAVTTENQNAAPDGDSGDSAAAARLHGSRQEGGARRRPPPRLLSNKEAIQQCGARLALALSRYRSRRLVAARRGRGVDFRRTIRQNLSAGGEPMTLMRRARKTQTAKLTVLLDVSASMQPHFSFFMLALRGMLSAVRAEVFIFHTRLARLAGPGGGLGARSSVTLDKFALQTQDVGGGTRIAGCLRDFTRLYGARLLGGRSVALIISDGYDGDDPGELASALAALRRRAPRLFWISPALVDGVLPAALSAARPHITSLASARAEADIDALARLWRHK